jgi:hypothetical protein
MENKIDFLVVDACCPHCLRSFLEKGKIVNYFWKNGKKLKVVASIIPGDYKKRISNELEMSVKLEKNELVEFVCQYCDKKLNFEHNKNIFVMKIFTQDGKEMEAIRSAVYGEEFTAILDNNKKYWFGTMTEKKAKELKDFANQIKEHYAKGTCFMP